MRDRLCASTVSAAEYKITNLDLLLRCTIFLHVKPVSGLYSLLIYLLQPMSFSPSPELKSLFETALNEFEKRAGTSLAQNQIINKLSACESADSVIDVLQEQAQAFRNFRGDNGKIMTWVKRTVNVVYALSTSEMLSGAISTVRVHSS
jgi:hypothetical protein